MIFLGENHVVPLDKASNGTITVATSAAADRNVLIEVIVRETFANGSGAQPTFKIGQTGTTNKFADTGAFTNLAEGAKRVFAGTLSAAKDLIITATAGTGTATGDITVKLVIIPQS